MNDQRPEQPDAKVECGSCGAEVFAGAFCRRCGQPMAAAPIEDRLDDDAVDDEISDGLDEDVDDSLAPAGPSADAMELVREPEPVDLVATREGERQGVSRWVVAVIAAAAVVVGVGATAAIMSAGGGDEDFAVTVNSGPAESAVVTSASGAPASTTEPPAATSSDVAAAPVQTSPTSEPGDALDAWLSENSAELLLQPITSPCGSHVVALNAEEVLVATRVSDDWVTDGISGRWLERSDGSLLPPSYVIAAERTGDNYPEVAVEWVPSDPDDVGRAVTEVLGLSEQCEWSPYTFISHCLSETMVDGFSILTMSGQGFKGPCSGRSNFTFEWVPDLGIFVGRLDDSRYTQPCPDGFEYQFELPIGVCHEGFFVGVVQRSLRSTVSPDIIDDGYFGESTQLAVLRYQKAEGLPLTGVVDLDTWAAMTPGVPYPDLDGNGVITPEEYPFD